MALTASEWTARHSTIVQTLNNDSVTAALADFWSLKFPQDRNWSQASPGKRLDVAHLVAWSSQGAPLGRDPNSFRAAAQPAVQNISAASLQVRDFQSVKILQKSAGSLVEIVKCRLDGQVYVLKSLVKGFAKRNAAIQTPNNEARLLQRQRQSPQKNSIPLLTPQLLAAFQTQNSVHLLMELIPSGDFSELLMAASSCGPSYPGRDSTGLLTEDWIFRYSVDMVQAIAWVHSQGYAHRDVKPGNFLLDNTGHLKLCDFSSAAPFSEYTSDTTTTRKVWNFYCSQPTGTCDYLSPEVLEAEEARVLQRQQRYLSMSCDDILGANFLLSEPPPDPSALDSATPGPYGPEVDWWSFGIMLYEMRFGVLPFFADKMEQTYESIKNHQHTLKLDPAVTCSVNLTLLIRHLLTSATLRLGRASSQEVQDHVFYTNQQVDWTQQWPVSAPFTPATNASASSSPAQHTYAPTAYANQSFSVVSSVPSFSALYTGNPDDFPLFEDSREFEKDSQHTPQDYLSDLENSLDRSNSIPPVMPRSTSSPAVVLSMQSPSTSLRNSLPASPAVARDVPRWSDCDTAFVGFSYLPTADAFRLPLTAVEHTGGDLSTAPSFADLAVGEANWPNSTPAASTPFTRGSTSVHSYPTPPSFAPSPAAASNAIKPAFVAGPARVTANLHQQTFVTPARKPSYMAMHDRFKQQGQGQEPEAAIPEHYEAQYTPAVPQSPYPFPVASVARATRMTEGKKMALKRPLLERAHSATPGGGSVGSDSRQSGGSKAIRDISEREAWDEMMAAVQKSVRKKQKDTGPLPISSVQKPARILRSTTDPQLSAPRPEPLSQQLVAPAEVSTENVSGADLARQAVAAKEVNAAPTEQPLRRKPSKPVLIVPRPVVMLPTPASPYLSESEDSLHDSPNHLFVPSHHALDIDMYDSDDSIDQGHVQRRGLNHKKSARQLLIRAQERGTPTKPKRTPSPSLTDAFGAPSPASSGAGGARLQGLRTRSSSPMLLSDNNSTHSLLSSSRDASYDKVTRGAFPHVRTRVLSSGEGNTENQSPNTSTEMLSGSLGKTSVTFAPRSYGSGLGTIAPLRDANGRSVNGADQLKSASTNAQPRNKAIRRKDSGEMLSQYRKGMGRATSMMSLDAQAKADAALATSNVNPRISVAMRGTAAVSPPIEDDFILGTVESGMRPSTSGAIPPSSSHRALRRFSSVLSLNKTEHASTQDVGIGRTMKSFGRFKSYMTSSSSTLNEDPNEGLNTTDPRHTKHTAAPLVTTAAPSKANEQSKPRLQVSKSQYRLRDNLPRSLGIGRNEATVPVPMADVSLMTGLNQRNSVLQGSLFGLEQRLARLKARLED